jgi:ClpP class serine protease
VFKRGAHADMLTADRPFDAIEAKLFDDNLLTSYRRFVELAAKGRGKTVEELEAVAQGRSWSGDEALKNGLIDGLGSLTFTIDYAAKKVGLSGREAVRVIDFDKRESPLEKLLAQDKDDDEAQAQSAALLASLLKASGFEPLARKLFPITAVAREVLGGQTLFPMVEYRVDVR